MVNWLNANQGFVMCLLTLVYVIATGIIVLYNRRTIEEMRVSREAESRPYVFVYLDKDPRELCFYLRVRNYGKSGAKIQSVSITPNLNLPGGALPENFLKNVVLAPSQNLEFIVVGKKDETLKNDYDIRVRYTSIGDVRKQYSDQYTLTVRYVRQMGYTDIKRNNLSDEANALRNIASHLDSIRRKL